MNFLKIIAIALTLSACATDPYKRINVTPLSWENAVTCNSDKRFYSPKYSHALYLCSVTYKKEMTKLFPNWEIGKTYMGLISADRKFSLEPIYERVWVLSNEFGKDSYVMYKKYEDKTYTFDGYYRNEKHPPKKITPVETIKLGKVFNSKPCDSLRTAPHKCLFSGAYSNNGSVYYFMHPIDNFDSKVENVDTDPEREKLFPAIDKYRSTNLLTPMGNNIMVRHLVDGRLYYQVYDPSGNKVGDEIPYEKVEYFHLQTTSSSLNKSSTFEARPWVHKGDDVYMPIIHYGEKFLFDGTKDYGDFLGFELRDLSNIPPDQIYTGTQLAENPKVKTSTHLVFKDEKGFYFTWSWYDPFMHSQDPIAIANHAKALTTELYRTKLQLPYYSGRLNKQGELEQRQVNVIESLDGLWRITKKGWKPEFNKYQAANEFKSIDEVQTLLTAYQKDVIAALEQKLKKEQEQAAYEAESLRIKKAVEANMAANWAERDRKEAEHNKKVAEMDRKEKEKEKKPFLLFNIDFTKLYDVELSKQRAACFRKMSNSKKAYLNGKQKWYYQGDCK